MANLLPLAVLKKVKIFSKSPSFFLKKSANFDHFVKVYFFSRILRQSCYNLMKKIDIQTREQPLLARLRDLNWQKSGQKKRTLFRGRFCFPYFQYGANYYCCFNFWRVRIIDIDEKNWVKITFESLTLEVDFISINSAKSNPSQSHPSKFSLILCTSTFLNWLLFSFIYEITFYLVLCSPSSC